MCASFAYLLSFSVRAIRAVRSPDSSQVDYVRTFTDHLIDITVSGDKVCIYISVSISMYIYLFICVWECTSANAHHIAQVPAWQSDHGQLMAILRIFEPMPAGSRPESRGPATSRNPVMLSDYVSRSLLSPEARRPEPRARSRSPRPHHQVDPPELPPAAGAGAQPTS
jgi:hypothetical protein